MHIDSILHFEGLFLLFPLLGIGLAREASKGVPSILYYRIYNI